MLSQDWFCVLNWLWKVIYQLLNVFKRLVVGEVNKKIISEIVMCNTGPLMKTALTAAAGRWWQWKKCCLNLSIEKGNYEQEAAHFINEL